MLLDLKVKQCSLLDCVSGLLVFPHRLVGAATCNLFLSKDLAFDSE